MIAKFKVGDKVGTNIQYMKGFNANHPAPPGLVRLKNLKIIKVMSIDESLCDSEFTEPFLYECESKSRTYFLNQCFLEAE